MDKKQKGINFSASTLTQNDRTSNAMIQANRHYFLQALPNSKSIQTLRKQYRTITSTRHPYSGSAASAHPFSSIFSVRVNYLRLRGPNGIDLFGRENGEVYMFTVSFIKKTNGPMQVGSIIISLSLLGQCVDFLTSRPFPFFLCCNKACAAASLVGFLPSWI